jgi:hypothetical protein
MTNTLHRFFGDGVQDDDFVVFAIPCRGYNDRDCVPKLREFLRLASQHNPVNMGDASHGAIYRANRRLTPLAHWFRKEPPDHERLVQEVSCATTVAAVFDRRDYVEAFLRTLQKAGLGLSINISAPAPSARACCAAAGFSRHSVEYALPPMGKTGKLAEDRVLQLAAMCGHGMVSAGLARKMMDLVREGRRSPEQAGEYMCRFCSCGVFNPRRAARILYEIMRD